MRKMRFEGETLEEAMIKASEEVGVSISSLNYRVIQYPSKGVFGILFKKQAIIEVDLPEETSPQKPHSFGAIKQGKNGESYLSPREEISTPHRQENLEKREETPFENYSSNYSSPTNRRENGLKSYNEGRYSSRVESTPFQEKREKESYSSPEEKSFSSQFEREGKSFYNSSHLSKKTSPFSSGEKGEWKREGVNFPPEESFSHSSPSTHPSHLSSYSSAEMEEHRTGGFAGRFASLLSRERERGATSLQKETSSSTDNQSLSTRPPFPHWKGGDHWEKVILEEIGREVGKLIEVSCFDVEVKEVSFDPDGRVFIRIDGPDNSLLIGREGYRYASLNTLLFVWLHQKYRLKLRLEVGDFLQNQTEMVKKLIAPTIQQVLEEGSGRTPALKGFLPYLAQELLRKEFPHKYVKVKEINGEKFVVVRPFYGHNSSNWDS